ncbi:MAG TPA: ABC transporter ATP-binding protein [Thermoanaerobaculaceae bacterium]|nr:ABC transporter ATP-binding protein [Thermoanaerobaculaceae bacterium]
MSQLSKRYQLGTATFSTNSLREVVTRAVSAPARRWRDGRRAATDERSVWALKGVSFDVARGEVVGIIGRNGAGKSTLLKVLSRVTDPTEGRVELRGRSGSLLEVGTGFHPELTGRENIYLNGTILGMRKSEIDRKFDEIVAFAEVERFLDTPVKRYSSGMYVRLAFAVAAHLEPEILVVDEVLAVGDAAFQDRCVGKMQEVAEGGRTVLLVSHNMAVIQRLCARALLLDGGRLSADGPAGEVVQRYLRSSRPVTGKARFSPMSRGGTGWARVTDVRFLDEHGLPVDSRPADADLIFELDLCITEPETRGASLRGLVLELVVATEAGDPLLSVMNVDDPRTDLPASDAGRVRVRLPGPTLIPGRYRLDIFLAIPHLQHVDEVAGALSFDVSHPERPWRPYEMHPSRGLFCKRAIWELVGS